MFVSLMSNQKAAKSIAVLQLSCVQHTFSKSMSSDAPLLGQEEQGDPWLS